MLNWLLVLGGAVLFIWGTWSRRGLWRQRSSVLEMISEASFVWLMLLLALGNQSVLWASVAGVSLLASGIGARLVARREQAASVRLDAEPQ